jgi:hypothetical protein
VVTELVSHENLAFLFDDPKIYAPMKKYGYDQTPTFASGEVYLSSLMDSLICQAYYNPALITVLKQLIIGESNSNKSNKIEEFEKVKCSNLYHLKVPKKLYVRKNYNFRVKNIQSCLKNSLWKNS